MLEVLLGFTIGLTLGLLGGGGSILTVPALVYLVGQNPRTAVTTSLMIVGANSLSGALTHRVQGTLNWRVALLFGGSGMAMAYLAAQMSKLVSSNVLLLLFALLMLVVAAFMVRKPKARETAPPQHWPVIVTAGVVVGALTGFLGVGGGFLIVPALVMLVGLPMQHAVGTSLMVIAMNSISGLLGHWGERIDWPVTLIFGATGIVGTLVGARLTRYVKPEQLRLLFAIFVIGLGLFLLYDSVTKLIT